jgi:hypothetical protein
LAPIAMQDTGKRTAVDLLTRRGGRQSRRGVKPQALFRDHRFQVAEPGSDFGYRGIVPGNKHDWNAKRAGVGRIEFALSNGSTVECNACEVSTGYGVRPDAVWIGRGGVIAHEQRRSEAGIEARHHGAVADRGRTSCSPIDRPHSAQDLAALRQARLASAER